MSHPCLRCGACCAVYRVAFYCTEAATTLGGPVPPELTVRLDRHRLAMKGAEGSDPRCGALAGTVDATAACTIYARRPSPCREPAPAWEAGRASPSCDRARSAHGLPPLKATDWDTSTAA
ncbi:YkgJ family cysteine cluster protein [Dokdonella koreensis]|nr:YkgJ family cysteine cluster protein [Dokdonella koreensis]